MKNILKIKAIVLYFRTNIKKITIITTIITKWINESILNILKENISSLIKLKIHLKRYIYNKKLFS